MKSVTKTDVTKTLLDLGVTNGDVILFHSSLKSFGHVEGGADAVIDGALAAIGKEGTLIAPTLAKQSFPIAYKVWNKDTSPAEIGLIPETFRRRPEALRSDQATHSCAAIGKFAAYLTEAHSTLGPRIFPYGNYAFSHGSPWQRLYDLDGKILLMGAPEDTVTMRHFVEAIYGERLIGNVRDEKTRAAMRERLVTYERIDEYADLIRDKKPPYPTDLGRFQFESPEARKVAPEIKKTAYCGSSLFTIFSARAFVDGMLKRIDETPEIFFNAHVVRFIKELKALA